MNVSQLTFKGENTLSITEKLNRDEINALSKQIETSTTIEIFNLGMNFITDKSLEIISEALINTNIHTLYLYAAILDVPALSNFEINDQDIKPLSEALKNNTIIHTLYLYLRRINVEELKSISKILHECKNLYTFNMRCSIIGPGYECVPTLVKALKNEYYNS